MKWCVKIFSWVALMAMAALPVLAAEPAAKTASTGPAVGKSFQIRNKQFGDLLRPEDANNADGTPIVLYPAQPWKCMTWKVSAAGESGYYLQNRFTSKTFNAAQAADGKSSAPVTQVPWGKEADKRPVWQITKLKDGTFKIADAKTGNVLTAQKSSSGSDVKIVLQPWADGDNQKWELQEIDPAKLTM